MNRLLTFGCSNTYGEGLPDCWKDNQHTKEPSKYAWPQLLADNLGLNCKNLSLPGTSNKCIANTVLNTDFYENDTVCIVWTFFSRSCTFLDNNMHKRIIVQDITNSRLEKSQRNYSKLYYQNFYTNNNSIIESFMYINLIKLFLDNKNIVNYHFSCNMKQNEIPDFHTFKALEWSCVDPISITDCFCDVANDKIHPGIRSHQKITEKIQQIIKN